MKDSRQFPALPGMALVMGAVLVSATGAFAADPSVTEKPVLLSPEESQKTITLQPGYEISLFASEKDFPIENPVAMQWDSKGRLWVANCPTYPHIRPDQEYQDSIVILEDTDHDGKADKYTVFADNLYLPIGFVIGDGGAYVSQEPNLIHLVDTDGNDVADKRYTILHGFGSEDSHHAISAFQWSPDGSFYMAEGTFLVSNVETPWGPRRTHDSAVWRFKPSIHRLDVFGDYGWSNPWGITFDKWGHPILMDASPGKNYYLPHLMSKYALDMIGPTEEYPGKHTIEELNFYKKGRPNSGAEFVSSHNFPEDVQGTYLNGQCIGFHGVRWIWTEEKGSGYTYSQTKDLLQASDTTFRPVDLMFGPDGALYVLDYYNPIVGHMQYVFRDERRDHSHGRIWRVRYTGKDLAKTPTISGAPVNELLDLLKDPILRTRHHARRELQERPWNEVQPALEKWVAALDPKYPDADLYRLEGFWIYQGHDQMNETLLKQLLAAKEPNVRASALRALRFETHRIDWAFDTFKEMVMDPHMRVRLEAVNGLSTMDSTEAAKAILTAGEELPMDAGLYHAMRRSLEYLSRFGDFGGEGSIFHLREMENDELLTALDKNWSELVSYEVLSRNVPKEAHAEAVEKLSTELKTGQVAALFQAADGIRRNGGVDFDNIARALGSLAPADAVEGKDAFLSYLRQEDAAETPGLVQAAYAGLLMNPDLNADETIEIASSQSQVDDLMAGAALISDGATLKRLQPKLLHYVKTSTEISSGAIRDALKGALRVKADRPALFKELGELARNGTYPQRRGAISAMQSLPLKEWPEGYDEFAGRLKIDKAKLAKGAEVYAREGMCGTCHQKDGAGVAGAFPPLVANAWVEGDPERLIKITNCGLIGEFEVDGVKYNSAMPPQGILLSDEEFAAVLTYVRTSWDNTGTEITADQVKTVKDALNNRLIPYTVEEILKEHPLK